MDGVAGGGPLRMVYLAVTKFGVLPISSQIDVKRKQLINGWELPVRGTIQLVKMAWWPFGDTFCIGSDDECGWVIAGEEIVFEGR